MLLTSKLIIEILNSTLHCIRFFKTKYNSIKNAKYNKFVKNATRDINIDGSGVNNNEIADTLGLTLNTIKAYAKELFKKLKTSTRTQAVEKARKLKIIL